MSNLTNKRIMIIDDSNDMRALMSVLFEAKGYETIFSSNGAEALAALESGQVLPDLILLDLQMPIMDGFEFLLMRSQIARICHIPVVVMSGSEGETVASIGSACCDILQKPFSMTEVLETIRRNLSSSDSSAPIVEVHGLSIASQSGI